MSIEVGLVSYLKAQAAITALITGRIYPERLPKDPTLPAVVYTKGATVQEYTMSGPDPLVSVSFQLDVWAERKSEALAVEAALKGALSGYAGAMGSVTVKAAFLLNTRSDYDPESKQYISILDVRILFVDS